MKRRTHEDPAATIHEYVVYKLGGLTVYASSQACNACGRDNLALRYVSTLGKRRSGGSVSVCHLCMKDISANHRDYMEARKPGST